MEKLYEAIKTRFDADATLAAPSGVFTALYAADQIDDPAAIARPFCVMIPSDDSRTIKTWGSIYRTTAFAFQIVDKTLELVGAHALLVNAVFDEPAAQITASGMQVLLLEKTGGRFIQIDADLWECVLEYSVKTREAR